MNKLRRCYKELVIAIGGSATNDGGMGVLANIGIRFVDKSGKILAGCVNEAV